MASVQNDCFLMMKKFVTDESKWIDVDQLCEKIVTLKSMNATMQQKSNIKLIILIETIIDCCTAVLIICVDVVLYIDEYFCSTSSIDLVKNAKDLYKLRS